MITGANTIIHALCFIGEKTIIGDNCRIQSLTYIPDNVIIRNRVFIGPGVVFTNDKYPPSHGAWKSLKPTIVDDDVSIGANSTILPNLSLGKGCHIGAGSVVTKDVKPGVVIAGNPARELAKN